jgi:hypothetical protein
LIDWFYVTKCFLDCRRCKKDGDYYFDACTESILFVSLCHLLLE